MDIEAMKNRYRPGTRIRLVSMDDTQAPPPGTEGEVIAVDALGDIEIQWDTGSTLSLIPGEDSFVVIQRICPVCGSRYKEYPALSRRDAQTEICSRCEMREALEDFGMTEEQIGCILEKMK